MKNWRELTRILLWSLILVILTGSFVSLMLNDGVFTPIASKTSTEVVALPGSADSEAPTAVEYTSDGGVVTFAADVIDEIDLSWISGSVEITTGHGDEIEFFEDYSGTSDNSLRYDLTDGVLRIRYCENSSAWSASLPSKHLTLTLPEKRYARLRIDLTSADLSVSGVTAQLFELDGLSGDAKLDDVCADTLTAETSSGKLTLTSCSAQTLSLSSVSGAVSAEGVFPEITVGSTSGSVKLCSAELPQSINVNTVSGDVTIAAPESVAFSYSFSSVSGDALVDLPGASSSKDASVRVNTVSGNLRLQGA